MDLVTLINVKLTATEVGRDSFGNRYYEERRARPVGCIIPSQAPLRKVATTGMSGSRTISQTLPAPAMRTGHLDMC